MGWNWSKGGVELEQGWGGKLKSDFILKNKLIFMFNDTGLDTQRFDQKINYICKTRFKF